jgi:hypothetical protein
MYDAGTNGAFALWSEPAGREQLRRWCDAAGYGGGAELILACRSDVKALRDLIPRSWYHAPSTPTPLERMLRLQPLLDNVGWSILEISSRERWWLLSVATSHSASIEDIREDLRESNTDSFSLAPDTH